MNLNYIIISLLLTFQSTLSYSQNWQLVWSDEFSDSISSDWVFETGRGSNGWGNNELQYYRKENATVENGALVVTAKKESFNGASYTSARLKTQGLKSWKYGKIEAKISLPSFQGAWPAFWMLGDNISSVGWPSCGEIDIMEKVNTTNEIHGTIHWQDHNLQYANYGTGSGFNGIGYHIYTVEWDSQFIRWFIDRVQYHIVNIENGVNGTDEFHEKYFIVLNMAIGGNWPGFNVDDSALPAKMHIDYVRVYQEGSAVNASTITKKEDTPKVLPNPSVGNITITNYSEVVGLSYEIFNAIGIKIKEGILNDSQISVDDISSGIYWLKLSNGKVVKFCKN
jgi:beta-glucanase (GH16 family)